MTEFIDGIPQVGMDRLSVDHEHPGLTRSPGYGYPDENVGSKVYPETKDYYLFSPVAYVKNGTWLLVVTPKYDRAVWINNYISLEKDNDVPEFQMEPSKDISMPNAIQNSKGIAGVIKSPFGESEAYAMPQSLSDKIVCKIPDGEKITAVAMLDKGLDVLVKSNKCNGYVWIWKINAEWEGFDDWTRLNLPIIKPKLINQPVLPQIKYVRRVKVDTSSKRRDRPLTVAVCDTKGNAHEWNSELPADYRANDQAAADLFAEIRRVPTIVDVCNYVPNGSFARIRLDYAVFLTQNDQTKLVAKTTIKGAMPPSCPSSMSSNAPSTGIGKPPFTEFIKWLKPIVQRP